MRTRPAPAHLGHRLTRVIAVSGVSVAMLTGCTAGDRPAFSDWNERWNDAQLLVPTERDLVEGGRPFCDQLLGQLRIELADLTPTPSESVDPAFDGWGEHLRTLAFECPTDPTEISATLSTIRQLEAEIAAATP
jgi:hypothetical protein